MQATAKRAALRRGLEGPHPVMAAGVHDAMSAKLAEAAGFEALWVSGFGVSTMVHAIPDLNLVTMTEMLDAAVRVDSATELPVIVDCDNGYGGAANMLRTVRVFERAGIAGVCVEDNQFPKRNSLKKFTGTRKLIPMEEQARRIRAAKAAQESSRFVFIARVEALIAGHGVEEACLRADAYAKAGADAILIHSRDRTLGDIRSFLASWNRTGAVPLVAVPTLYPSYSVDDLHEEGFQLVIFANHAMRAALRAMGETLQQLAETRRADSVEDRIAPLETIFDLLKTKEVAQLDGDVESLSARSAFDERTAVVDPLPKASAG